MDGLERVRANSPSRVGIGVRAQLSAMVLIAILPLLALLLFGAVKSRRLILDSAATHALDLARFGAQRQDDGFLAARAVLSALRSLPRATLTNRDDCHAALAGIGADHPQFGSLGLVDSGGVISCLSTPAEPRPFRDAELLAAARAGDRASVVVGKYMVGSVTGRPVVVLATPLPPSARDAGAPIVAYVSLDLDWAARHAWDLAGPADATLSLIDTRGATVLARSAGQAGFVGTSVAGSPLAAAMLAHPDGGAAETVDIDGTPGIFGFAPLVAGGGRGLMVAVGLSRAQILAGADRRLTIAVAVALATAALAAGAAWLFADRTQLRAIRSLVAAANRIGAGDLRGRAAMGRWQGAEFRTLSAALGDMAGAIEGAQARLAAKERLLRLIAENSTDLIMLLGPDGRRVYASPACRTLLGFEPEEMLGTHAAGAIHPDDGRAGDDPNARIGEAPATFVNRMRRKDGGYVWVESIWRTIRQEDGQTARLVVVRDIDQRVAAEQRLKESESRYRYLTEHGADAVIQYDLDLARRYVSPACRDILGYGPEEMAAAKPLGLVHPDDVDHVVETFQSVLSGRVERAVALNRMRRRDGVWIWIEGHLRMLRDPQTGAPSGVIVSMRDVTIRKEAEDKLAEANRRLEMLAGQDGLTGLANRRVFDVALRREHRRAVEQRSSLAMIMIDVDRFKAFNDHFGHPAGDACLRRVARAIESASPWLGDLVARYGGEEFAALLPDTDEAGAAVVAERIRLAVLTLAIEHDAGPAGLVTVSAGVAALEPRNPDGSLEALVLHADRALYCAKHGGRNQIACASAEPLEKSDAA
ncbi:MAG: diguanylate cyclase [Roseiarcus sp.]